MKAKVENEEENIENYLNKLNIVEENRMQKKNVTMFIVYILCDYYSFLPAIICLCHASSNLVYFLQTVTVNDFYLLAVNGDDLFLRKCR